MELTPLRKHPAMLGGLLLIAVMAPIAGLFLPFYSAVLVAWNAGILLYLCTALVTACRLSPPELRQQAEAMDEGANAVTAGAVVASLVALTAVVLELSGRRNAAWAAPLAGVTIILSWSFIHVLFAHRYAHENALRGGLDFPGEDEPDFLESLYFAFTIGMTAQVSDVTTNSAPMRRLVLFHALLAFVFNAAVVAAAVNLAAGLAA